MICVKFEIFSDALLRPTVLGEKTNRSNSKGGKACKLLRLQSLLWHILQLYIYCIYIYTSITIPGRHSKHPRAWQRAASAADSGGMEGWCRRVPHGDHQRTLGRKEPNWSSRWTPKLYSVFLAVKWTQRPSEILDLWLWFLAWADCVFFSICARSFKSCWKLLSRWPFWTLVELVSSSSKWSYQSYQASKATVPEGTAKEFLTNMATFVPQRHITVSWCSVWILCGFCVGSVCSWRLCPSSTSQATAFYSAEAALKEMSNVSVHRCASSISPSRSENCLRDCWQGTR